MPIATTGFANLPDIGTLSYNTVTFTQLYKSEISGPPIQDDARRTTKYVEYTLTVDGVVTLKPGDLTTDDTWGTLRKKLSVHGGMLTYTGKGFGTLIVNQPGGNLFDVAFGPVPKILSFQPLGASRSAIIKWQVVFRIPELPPRPATAPADAYPRVMNIKKTGNRMAVGTAGTQLQTPAAIVKPLPQYVLQFNYEASISYDENGYSSYFIRGVLEIPMTRRNVDDRTLPDHVQAYRQAWLDIQVDLTKFKVTRRKFNYNRDKRICEWEFAAEELAPMGLPAYSTGAGGTMSVRPAMKIPPWGIIALSVWFVNLRCTYTIRKDFPMRAAWWAFVSLLWSRMQSSADGEIPPELLASNAPHQKPPSFNVLNNVPGLNTWVKAFTGGVAAGQAMMGVTQQAAQTQPQPQAGKVLLTDFGFDEGLYNDSKTVTFHAGWFLPTTIRSLFAATGAWSQPPGTGGNLWAGSVQDVMGWKSWLINGLDPAVDVIVDLVGGAPPTTPIIGQ